MSTFYTYVYTCIYMLIFFANLEVCYYVKYGIIHTTINVMTSTFFTCTYIHIHVRTTYLIISHNGSMCTVYQMLRSQMLA